MDAKSPLDTEKETPMAIARHELLSEMVGISEKSHFGQENDLWIDSSRLNFFPERIFFFSFFFIFFLVISIFPYLGRLKCTRLVAILL